MNNDLFDNEVKSNVYLNLEEHLDSIVPDEVMLFEMEEHEDDMKNSKVGAAYVEAVQSVQNLLHMVKVEKKRGEDLVTLSLHYLESSSELIGALMTCCDSDRDVIISGLHGRFESDRAKLVRLLKEKQDDRA